MELVIILWAVCGATIVMMGAFVIYEGYTYDDKVQFTFGVALIITGLFLPIAIWVWLFIGAMWLIKVTPGAYRYTVNAFKEVLEDGRAQ